MKLALALTLGILVGSVAHAADNAKSLPQCAPLVQSCEYAGFKIGGHKNNDDGVWVDCIGGRAHNKTVKGVSFSQADAQACEAVAKPLRQQKK